MHEQLYLGIATIIAVLVGPIAAVLVTRWTDNRRIERDRRMDVFRNLMRTRRLRLSPDHVAALNLVEIEFYRIPSVIEAWKNYWESLNKQFPTSPSPTELEGNRQDQERLLSKLLYVMAKSLQFDIEHLEIFGGGYTPKGWADIESQQNVLRSLLIETFSGNRAFPVSPVVNPTPTSPYPPAPVEVIKQPGKHSGLPTITKKNSEDT